MIDVEAMPHLADIPRVQASIRPDEEAFWFEGETTSFAELETRSTQIACSTDSVPRAVGIRRNS